MVPCLSSGWRVSHRYRHLQGDIIGTPSVIVVARTRNTIPGASSVRRPASSRIAASSRIIASVRGNTRLIQENRLIVHVRPVIHREVIVHRTHTIVKDVVLHRVNTINKWREVNRTQVINVNGGGTVRHVTEYRNVRGVNCNCGYERRGYEGGGYYRGSVVSYRY